MSESTQGDAKKRERLRRPYPQNHLNEALEVARSIRQNNAGLPFDRVRLAKSMGTTPKSSAFVTKLNSSKKYGLTEGGYAASRISPTPLGARAADGDREALVEAAMFPEKFKMFYELLNGKRVPSPREASGVVVDDIRIPEPLVKEYLAIVVTNGQSVGIVTEVGGSSYVSLSDLTGAEGEEAAATTHHTPGVVTLLDRNQDEVSGVMEDNRITLGRLFVAHFGAHDIADRIARLLGDFSIAHVIVDIEPLDSSPLSRQTADQMKGCSGAIIVLAEPSMGHSGREVSSSRIYRMLMQFGAAMDRFNGRVVMVVGPEIEHLPHDVRKGVRTVHVDGDDSEAFELELLRESVRMGMMVISIADGTS